MSTHLRVDFKLFVNLHVIYFQCIHNNCSDAGQTLTTMAEKEMFSWRGASLFLTIMSQGVSPVEWV